MATEYDLFYVYFIVSSYRWCSLCWLYMYLYFIVFYLFSRLSLTSFLEKLYNKFVQLMKCDDDLGKVGAIGKKVILLE